MNSCIFSVTARSHYLADQSAPEAGKFVFAYTMTIRNTGTIAAQIISRYWRIIDGVGRTEEVRGLGVVGHQPLLQANEHFEYTSGATIATPVGTMQGHYFCVTEEGEPFEVMIPEFTLALPGALH